MFQPDLLHGMHVLITGGGTGLGKSMGRRFLELGASLTICGRRGEVLEATAAEHRAATAGTVRTRVCDVRDAAAVDAMIEAADAAEPLAALVNNAAGNFVARSEELSSGAVDAVVGIVLKGSLNCTLACGRRWLAAGRSGTVLSIVTSYAWTGSAYVLPSAVAKAGVLAMTRSLAVEWGGRGVRLNAIAPGPFPTEGAWQRLVPRADLARAFETRNPLRRPGRHEELADLASFLLSGRSGFVNGEVVTIDGGEWLEGAGQFSFLGRMMGDADWAALRPRGKNS
ncbi:MAG TPA: SDR family oxidoreductase [Geminicoccaceae bacterium]|nr:SDR family oxidoreductase [Geminicoccaceae bacterium]